MSQKYVTLFEEEKGTKHKETFEIIEFPFSSPGSMHLDYH